MTVVLFFDTDDGYRTLVERVPSIAAAMETGAAYATEPNFVGASIIPDDNLLNFDPTHTYETLTQANAA